MVFLNATIDHLKKKKKKKKRGYSNILERHYMVDL